MSLSIKQQFMVVYRVADGSIKMWLPAFAKEMWDEKESAAQFLLELFPDTANSYEYGVVSISSSGVELVTGPIRFHSRNES